MRALLMAIGFELFYIQDKLVLKTVPNSSLASENIKQKDRIEPVDGPDRIESVDGPDRIESVDGPDRIEPVDGPDRIESVDGPERIESVDGPFRSYTRVELLEYRLNCFKSRHKEPYPAQDKSVSLLVTGFNAQSTS